MCNILPQHFSFTFTLFTIFNKQFGLVLLKLFLRFTSTLLNLLNNETPNTTFTLTNKSPRHHQHAVFHYTDTSHHTNSFNAERTYLTLWSHAPSGNLWLPKRIATGALSLQHHSRPDTFSCTSQILSDHQNGTLRAAPNFLLNLWSLFNDLFWILITGQHSVQPYNQTISQHSTLLTLIHTPPLPHSNSNTFS